ncbi:hypothetical protein [Actinobaculum sp. 313]|nr:hypothetical protein [Actinobaculum sp. 313]
MPERMSEDSQAVGPQELTGAAAPGLLARSNLLTHMVWLNCLPRSGP